MVKVLGGWIEVDVEAGASIEVEVGYKGGAECRLSKKICVSETVGLT